jgi:hypothetical protein
MLPLAAGVPPPASLANGMGTQRCAFSPVRRVPTRAGCAKPAGSPSSGCIGMAGDGDARVLRRLGRLTLPLDEWARVDRPQSFASLLHGFLADKPLSAPFGVGCITHLYQMSIFSRASNDTQIDPVSPNGHSQCHMENGIFVDSVHLECPPLRPTSTVDCF